MSYPRKGNKTDYDRMLLETLDPETRFYQFATKKPLPVGEGNAVQWNRPRRLGFGQKLTAGIKPSANELSTIRVSAIIEQYGGYTLLEDLVQLVSITNVMDMATQELAKQAAETIDRSIVHAILFFDDPNTATSAVHVSKSSAALLISTNTFVANTYSNVLIAVSDIRRCVAELRRRNVATVDGQNYIGVVNPVVSEDLRSDSTWQNWHQYTTPKKFGPYRRNLISKDCKLRGNPERIIRSQALLTNKLWFGIIVAWKLQN